LDYIVLILFILYLLFILYAHYFFDKKQKIVKVDKKEQTRVRNKITFYEQLEVLSMINTNKK
jgi:Ca2+/Na+ antiporter